MATLAVFAAAAGVLAQNQPAKQSVWDGVYTEAQAARGERQYGRSCEQCHGPDMSGDQVEEIPSLVLDSFMTDWNGKSVRELFDTVKRSMPKDKPGSLGTGGVRRPRRVSAAGQQVPERREGTEPHARTARSHRH